MPSLQDNFMTVVDATYFSCEGQHLSFTVVNSAIEFVQSLVWMFFTASMIIIFLVYMWQRIMIMEWVGYQYVDGFLLQLGALITWGVGEALYRWTYQLGYWNLMTLSFETYCLISWLRRVSMMAKNDKTILFTCRLVIFCVSLLGYILSLLDLTASDILMLTLLVLECFYLVYAMINYNENQNDIYICYIAQMAVWLIIWTLIILDTYACSYPMAQARLFSWAVLLGIYLIYCQLQFSVYFYFTTHPTFRENIYPGFKLQIVAGCFPWVSIVKLNTQRESKERSNLESIPINTKIRYDFD